MPLPDRDFDTTEVAVPWKLLSEAGHEVVFATAHGGTTPACDPLLLSGVLFGQLGAEAEPKRFYAELTQSPRFVTPRSWRELWAADFDALVLPGGHAKGMRPYLEDVVLQDLVRKFFERDVPVGAICHGTIVCARTIRGEGRGAGRGGGRSVLYGRRTTCLPKYMERSAYLLTAWKLGDYYRTYPAYVEDEVRAALQFPEDFARGPYELTRRGTRDDDAPAFVVEDGNYVSARWPGDAYLFAKALVKKLE